MAPRLSVTCIAICAFLQISLSIATVVTTLRSIKQDDNNPMPLPFTRELKLQTPAMFGNDVMILQNMLTRLPKKESNKSLDVTSKYDNATASACRHLQAVYNLTQTGIFDANAARVVLRHLSVDGYKVREREKERERERKKRNGR